MKTTIEKIEKEINNLREEIVSIKNYNALRFQKLENPPQYKMGQKINDNEIISGYPSFERRFSERIIYDRNWIYDIVNTETGEKRTLWESEIRGIIK